jgi:N-formylglutamate amidohydrolase
MNYGFAVVHIPHASVDIPEKYRKTILLDEKKLRREMLRMTDAFCGELYDAPEFPVRVIASVSRFVCDMERFRDDRLEPCAKKGQGLMYLKTTYGRRLRNYDEELRNTILAEIYDPHHAKLTAAVDEALARYGKCLVIDGHSFGSRMILKPDNTLVFPFAFPDFDIGTDAYHTPPALCDAICGKVRELGYRPRVNAPFDGVITPMKYYQKDKRVVSVMFEANRKLYMNEKDMTKSAAFQKTREACHSLMRFAAEYVNNTRIEE